MKRKVTILGEINVDLIMTGNDVTPEWNREKLVDSFHMAMGSSSVITAVGLAKLGMEVSFIGVVGDDDFGRFMLREMKRMGIRTAGVLIDANARTGVTLSLSTSKDRAFLTYMGSIGDLEPSILPGDLLDEADHLHFGSFYLQERMRPHWAELFRKARAAGITTSFDTGWDPVQHWHRKEIENLLPHTSLFIPSEDEALAIFEVDGIAELTERLPSSRGEVAVKCGSKGSVRFGIGESPESYSPFPANVIDTTGAGDSFNAGLIYGLLTGMDTSARMRFANACGALATERIGGASSAPGLEEVERFLVR